MEGNLLVQIDWASLIAGRKFSVFALFYLFIIYLFKDSYNVQGREQ